MAVVEAVNSTGTARLFRLKYARLDHVERCNDAFLMEVVGGEDPSRRTQSPPRSMCTKSVAISYRDLSCPY